MKDEIYFIEKEITSVLHAAVGDAKPYAYRQELIRKVNEYKRTTRQVLIDLTFFICIYAPLIYFALLLEPDKIGIAYVTALIFAIVLSDWVSNLLDGKRKRRFVSSVLRKDRVRPQMCIVCFFDLRYTEADECPKCGTAITPVTDTKP